MSKYADPPRTETPQTEGSPVASDIDKDQSQPEPLTKPPPATCPNIDKTQRAMRRLHWRIRHGDGRNDEDAVLREGLALLEKVRSENAEMRKAFYEMKERLKKAGLL